MRTYSLRRADHHDRAGCFVASFDPDDANPHLNCAVPDDDAAPKRSDIERLRAEFERRRRKPRLEHVAAAVAGVAPAGLEAGFLVEGRLPLMVCLAAPSLPQLAGLALEIVREDALLATAARVQACAFGSGKTCADGLRRLVVRDGAVAIAPGGAQRIYAPAGFSSASEQLHIPKDLS